MYLRRFDDEQLTSAINFAAPLTAEVSGFDVLIDHAKAAPFTRITTLDNLSLDNLLDVNVYAPSILPLFPSILPLFMEAEDVAGDATTDQTLVNGQRKSGDLGSADDVDWFSVSLAAGQEYGIQHYHSSGGVTIRLVDSNGDDIVGAAITVTSSYSTTIRYTAAADMTAYVVVEGNGVSAPTDASRTYSLILREIVNDYAGDATTMAITAPNQSIVSRIDYPDDVDWITLDVVAGETYTVKIYDGHTDFSLVNAAGDPISGVRDVSYTLSASHARILAYTATETESLYIRLTDDDVNLFAPQDVTINVLSGPINNDDHGDNASDATPVSVGEHWSGVNNYNGDVDWFSVVLEDGQSVRVQGSGYLFDDIHIYNEDGVSVEANNLFGAIAGYRIDADVAGTYYIEVRSRDVAAGDYNVFIADITDDVGQSIDDAGALVSYQTLEGYQDFEGDVDWYAVTLNAGDFAKFTLSGGEDDFEFNLYDENGSALDLNNIDESLEAFGVSSDGLNYLAETSGTYYVGVSYGPEASFDNRPYELTYYGPDDHGDLPSAATLITESMTLEGQVNGPLDQDWFEFEAQAGDFFVFSLYDDIQGASEDDPQNPSVFWGPFETNPVANFSLFDADGNVVSIDESRADSQIDGQQNRYYSFDTDGSYYIRIESTAGVNYDLTMADSGDRVGNTSASASEVEIGETLSGALDYVWDADAFSFSATSGQVILFSFLGDIPHNGRLSFWRRDGSERLTSLETAITSDTSIEIDFGNFGAGDYYLNVDALGNLGNYTIETLDITPLALEGDAADNELQGGAGNDILTGLAGADVFVFGHSSGHDRVTDFTLSEDKIALDYGPYLDWADLTNGMTDFEGYMTLDLGDGTLIRIDGISSSQLTVDDFIIGYNDVDGQGPFLHDYFIFNWDKKESSSAAKKTDITPVLPSEYEGYLSELYLDGYVLDYSFVL